MARSRARQTLLERSINTDERRARTGGEIIIYTRKIIFRFSGGVAHVAVQISCKCQCGAI